MNSLRWRIALWFAASLLAVLAVYVAITNAHLQHELRVEKWERAHPDHSDWTLHASFNDAEVADIADELRTLSLIYVLPVAALALGLGFYLARKSLQPIEEISEQVQAISADTLHHRLRLSPGGAEFRSIETNVNALLGRLDESFRNLSEFSAKVAHEVRTPLTLLRLQVEEAAGRIDPALAESLQEELRRLSDYVDQCLLLATAEQKRVKVDLAPIPLRAFVANMIEVYELLARSEQRTLTITATSEITVTGDERCLRQMLHNLFTNALRHGLGDIGITIEQVDSVTFCRVQNTANPQPSATAAGTGLGLRIVRALAAMQPSLTFQTYRSGNEYFAELSWR
jgi:signal transduction histidine kinase